MPSNSRRRPDGGRAQRARNFTDIAFTAAVRATQARLGARERDAELERAEGGRTAITPALAEWLAERTSFFLGTASADGRPYVQHRGGPAGFLTTLDERHPGWADFTGNRQYITIGNLSENDRAVILAVDHAEHRRLKLWGRAEAIETPEFVERVTPPGLAQRPARGFRFRVEAWDVNCPSHIPQLFTLEQVEAATRRMMARIEALEAELEELRATPTKER